MEVVDLSCLLISLPLCFKGMLSHQLKQHVIDGEKTIIQNPTDQQRYIWGRSLVAGLVIVFFCCCLQFTAQELSTHVNYLTSNV